MSPPQQTQTEKKDRPPHQAPAQNAMNTQEFTGERLSLPEEKANSTAAVEINRLHQDVVAASRATLEKAIRIGELLVTVKASLPHGKWLPWLKANVGFSRQTANNYRSVFERRSKLLNVGNLVEAYALLSERITPLSSLGAQTLEDKRNLTEVSQELFEAFWKVVRQYAEELSKICDRADGFQDNLEALFFYRWVLEETNWVPEVFSEHRNDVAFLMEELKKDYDSFRLLLPWICQRALTRLGKAEKKLLQQKAALLPTLAALLDIRDNRLYRQTHATFEDYCRERWGLEPGLLEAISRLLGRCAADATSPPAHHLDSAPEPPPRKEVR